MRLGAGEPTHETTDDPFVRVAGVCRAADRHPGGRAADRLGLGDALSAQSDPNTLVDPKAYQDLRWRNVGPQRGGRVTAIAGVRSQPSVFYMGATGGGVWKTENYGITWSPVERRADRHGLDREHRCLGSESLDRLGRDRQRGHSQQRHHRARDLQVGRRREDVAVHGAARRRADRRRRHSPHQPGHRVGSGARIRRSAPTPNAASSRPTDGGKTWKKVLFVNDETGGARRRGERLEPERALRGDVPRLPQGVGHHQRRTRRPRAASTSRPTAARRGRSCRRACRRSSSARSTSRSPAATRRSSTRWSRRRAPRAASTSRSDAGATWTLVNNDAAAARPTVLLPLRGRQSQERERGVGQRAAASTSPPTAARPSRG